MKYDVVSNYRSLPMANYKFSYSSLQFRNTACMMHMGNMTKDFVPVGKEEQAEIKDPANCEKVAELLGIDCEWMITYFCKPKLKVGTEWVQKGSTCTNAANSVAGIARAIYERTFRITVRITINDHP